MEPSDWMESQLEMRVVGSRNAEVTEKSRFGSSITEGSLECESESPRNRRFSSSRRCACSSSCCFRCSSCLLEARRSSFCSLRTSLSCSIFSSCCFLTSLDFCAAARFRSTRSTRRCSFSSAVFARFRGARFVVGVGSCWPHDFRFLTGFFSGSCFNLASSSLEVFSCEMSGMFVESKFNGDVSRELIKLSGEDVEKSDKL